MTTLIVGTGMAIGGGTGFVVGAWLGDALDRGDYPITMLWFAPTGALIGAVVGGLGASVLA